MKSKEELGKHLLNIGVAIIVFAVIQPIMDNKVDFIKLTFAVVAYIFLVSVGYFFIKMSEDTNNG